MVSFPAGQWVAMVFPLLKTTVLLVALSSSCSSDSLSVLVTTPPFAPFGLGVPMIDLPTLLAPGASSALLAFLNSARDFESNLFLKLASVTQFEYAICF